jgi:Carboxypeptidase regulatory-like domain
MRANCLLAFVACVTSVATAQNIGRITGTVMDEHGQVVEDATVCLSVPVDGISSSSMCQIFTDHGQFQIPKVKFGSYGVFAIQEAEGYSIDNQSPGQKVTVSAADPSPEVTVRLRPAGPVLSGTVRDKIDGKPVKGVRVQYLDVDGKASGSSFLNTDGGFHVTLPPECDLVVIVSAKGYKGWVYTDALSPTYPVLRLGAGERKQLDIQLEPSDHE